MSACKENKAAELEAPFLNELEQGIQAKLGGRLTSWD